VISMAGGGEGGGADEVVFKKRIELIEHEQFSLSPLSLVGSWFHRLENGEIIWDGVVVGEVQPGRYLCLVRKGLEGDFEAQVIMPIDSMLAKDEGYEWRFYDDKETMIEAYAAYVTRRELA